LSRANSPARDEIEIVDQPRHAGVVAVRLARLQREAFAQGARADPGRVQRLDQFERALDLCRRDAQFFGEREEIAGEIAGLVDLADQPRRDERLALVMRGRADLIGEIFGQRGVAIGAVLEIGWAFLGHPARAGRAAPVALISLVARTGIGVERARRDVERLGAVEAAVAAVLARFGGRVAIASAVAATIAIAALVAGLAHLEQRIALQRFADEGLDLQVGQRQQLDRLLQLRRHHQRLRLAQIETRAQRHGRALKLKGR
jgi:hypothetical protein